MNELIDRRKFIAAAALLTGGGLTGVLFLSKDAANGGVSAEWAGLNALACESIDGNALGDWYLARHPGEADPNVLMRSIFGADDLESESAEGVRERLRDLIRLDFEQGNTVQAEGWTLSIRELQFCALVMLLRTDSGQN